METEAFILPGEILDAGSLPSHPVLPLKIGPGLRHTPPDTIRSTVAGHLCIDRKKNAIWVEYKGSRVILTLSIVIQMANPLSIFQQQEI